MPSSRRRTARTSSFPRDGIARSRSSSCKTPLTEHCARRLLLEKALAASDTPGARDENGHQRGGNMKKRVLLGVLVVGVATLAIVATTALGSSGSTALSP